MKDSTEKPEIIRSVSPCFLEIKPGDECSLGFAINDGRLGYIDTWGNKLEELPYRTHPATTTIACLDLSINFRGYTDYDSKEDRGKTKKRQDKKPTKPTGTCD